MDSDERSSDERSSDEPDLQQQTIELGLLLKSIADGDPAGRPGPAAATAFRHWLEVGKDHSTEARYFEDVAENFDLEANSNRDLFTLFEFLHPYVDVPDDEDDTPGAFIGLPMA